MHLTQMHVGHVNVQAATFTGLRPAEACILTAELGICGGAIEDNGAAFRTHAHFACIRQCI